MATKRNILSVLPRAIWHNLENTLTIIGLVDNSRNETCQALVSTRSVQGKKSLDTLMWDDMIPCRCVLGFGEAIHASGQIQRIAKEVMKKRSTISNEAKLILGIILESDNHISRLRLMNLLFLAAQDSLLREYNTNYDFFPYHLGPYSFMAERDFQQLIQNAFVQEKDQNLIVTRPDDFNISYQHMSLQIKGALQKLIQKYKSLSDSCLTNVISERHSSYAALIERDGKCPCRQKAPLAIYTIGYESITIDRFLDTLVNFGIIQILDVRKNPISRKFGFSGKTLLKCCNEVGINYLHFSELGIASENRQNLNDTTALSMLFTYYENVILPQNITSIHKISVLMKEKPSALVCFERNAGSCHRGVLARIIANETKMKIVHLKVPNE